MDFWIFPKPQPLREQLILITINKLNEFTKNEIIKGQFVKILSLSSLKMTDSGIVASAFGGLLIASLVALGINQKEGYAEYKSNTRYPTPPQFYAGTGKKNPLAAYRSPNQAQSGGSINVNLDNTGSQLLAYQLYQQAVNASTPTAGQLAAVSGQSQEQTGYGANSLGGGLSDRVAPYAVLNDGGPPLYGSEFQAVNLGNERAQAISACAQNAPTFVATSLLPKPAIPGQQAWEINAPNNILANQNFLSAVQQIGVDTTLSSRRYQSYDIRNTIPNPINVVSPWNNTWIMPDLERRPLDCFVPQDQGLYGCGGPAIGANTNPTFVGQ